MKPKSIQSLINYLEKNQWEDADSCTKSLIRKGDLKTIDELWTKYSDGRFGLTIQSKIWKESGGREYPSAKDFGYQAWMESGDVNDPYKDIERSYNTFVRRVGWNNNTSEIPPGYYPKSYAQGNDLTLCKHLTFIIEMHREEKRRSLLADPTGVEKYGKSKYYAGQKVIFSMKVSKYNGCIATIKRAVNSAFVEVEFDDGYRTIQSDNKFSLCSPQL
jgi:hypothetical protein